MSRTAWQRKPPDIWLKQNDGGNNIDEQLLDSTGAAVNLTSASVKFMLYAPGAASPKVNAAATIVTPASGLVRYAPSASDTDTIGDYLLEWQVTFSGGAVLTFPQVGWQKVRITDDLAA